jgi:hypothetical protein
VGCGCGGSQQPPTRPGDKPGRRTRVAATETEGYYWQPPRRRGTERNQPAPKTK